MARNGLAVTARRVRICHGEAGLGRQVWAGQWWHGADRSGCLGRARKVRSRQGRARPGRAVKARRLCGMARPGQAGHGRQGAASVWSGTVRTGSAVVASSPRGMAGHGLSRPPRLGVDRQGVARNGSAVKACPGYVRYGEVWPSSLGSAGPGQSWCGRLVPARRGADRKVGAVSSSSRRVWSRRGSAVMARTV
jgi:hypothetical protein